MATELPISFRIHFSEPVVWDGSGLEVTGTANITDDSFTADEDGRTYHYQVIAATAGTIIVAVPEAIAVDADGYENHASPNTAEVEFAPVVEAAFLVTKHGPYAEDWDLWELTIEPYLIDPLDHQSAIAFVEDPENGHLIGAQMMSGVQTIADYGALGYDIGLIATVLGLPGLAINDVVTTDAIGSTMEITVVGGAAIVEGSVAPSVFYPDPPSGTFEDEDFPLGKWFTPAVDASDVVFSRSTEQAHTGTHSGKLVSTATTAAATQMYIQLPEPGVDPDPVAWDPDDYENIAVKLRARLWTASTYVDHYLITVLWYDEDMIQNAGGASANIPDPALNGWVYTEVFDNALATARYIWVRILVSMDGDTPAGEVVYVDDIAVRSKG